MNRIKVISKALDEAYEIGMEDAREIAAKIAESYRCNCGITLCCDWNKAIANLIRGTVKKEEEDVE